MGYFELADSGTIFLDEIAEMKVSTQAKFLRILQEGTFRRLSGSKEIHVDVRVVAATNKNPAQAVQDGLIREDLYYRLNVFSIQLPPLRERREDLPLLIRSFLEEFKEKYGTAVRNVDAGTLTMLTEYDWPGNVRELRNVLERAVLVAQGHVITSVDLPPNFLSHRRRPVPEPHFSVGITIDAAEKGLILATLERTRQNKTRAAEILGISLKTLHNKLARYREEAASLADPQE